MRVAIASDDQRTIASHLGRVRGFLVYDIADEVQHRHYRENTFTGHARGLSGAGHGADRHGPILAALGDCDAVIAHGMGRRIHEDLHRAGIQAFIVEETDPDKAVALFLQGALGDRPELGCDGKHHDTTT